MKIACIGGGPAGLYLGILMKLASGRHQVTVFERNRADDTFGFGVVFSDATLGNLAAADPASYDEIRRNFARWDDIDIHFRGEVLRSTGHGFCGLERKLLLTILQRRAAELGVATHFETPVQSLADLGDHDVIVGADGVASWVRDQHAEHFGPAIDVRPNRFVWLGTTFPFKAFTFYFKESEHGLFRVHAYPYAEGGSTFIVECTADTWQRAGLEAASEDDTIGLLERVFAEELAGHRLIKNRSIWRNFPTVRNRSWRHDNVVLVGDAAHTAHFSIGSGTKLAMEDAIALRDALVQEPDIEAALSTYELVRRPEVEALQQAAQVSLEWFESTERYLGFEPVQFAYSLLTRSLRVTHTSLKKRDPELVQRLEGWFARGGGNPPGLPSTSPQTAAGATAASAVASVLAAVPPPMFVPLRLRDMVVPNRVALAPWPLDAAEEGMVGDAHLVFFGARASAGVGLLMTESCRVLPGEAGPRAAGMASDDHAVAWRRVVEYVHGSATPSPLPARIGCQLGGAGLAPASASERSERYRAFVDAALRAAFAGFDLLQLDFTRSDDDPAALGALVEAVRAAWPAGRPLAVRVSAPSSGSSIDAVIDLTGHLARNGADLVAVARSVRLSDKPGSSSRPGRLQQTPLSERIRNQLAIATLTEEDVTSSADINSVLAAGRADLCGLGRTLVFDSSFVVRAAQAQNYELPWPGLEDSDGYLI